MRRSQKSRTVRRRSSSLRRRLRNSARTTRPYRRKSSSKRRRYRRSNNRRSNKRSNGSNGSKRRSKGRKSRKRRSNRSNRRKKTHKKRRIVGGAPTTAPEPEPRRIPNVAELVMDLGVKEGKGESAAGLEAVVNTLGNSIPSEAKNALTTFANKLKTEGVPVVRGESDREDSGDDEINQTKVYERVLAIFNGQAEGAGFNTAVGAFTDKYLGTDNAGAMVEWMRKYLEHILIATKASDADGAPDYFNFTDGNPEVEPGANFAKYIAARAKLVTTITEAGELSKFKPLRVFAQYRSKEEDDLGGERAVEAIITNRLNAMIPAVQARLYSYFPQSGDGGDIYAFNNDGEVIAAFNQMFVGLNEGTFGEEDGRKARMTRRIEQIIGSLYLDNNAKPGKIWDAFHNRDLTNVEGDDAGAVEAEIQAWLGAEGANCPFGNLGDGLETRPPSHPNVPAAGEINETHIFGTGGGEAEGGNSPTIPQYLAALAGTREEFIAFMKGEGSALARYGVGVIEGADRETQVHRRRGFDYLAKRVIATRIRTLDTNPGPKIRRKLIDKFTNEDVTSLEERNALVKTFLEGVDLCTAAMNNEEPVPDGATTVAEFYGQSFATSSDEVSQRKFVFFPVNDVGLAKGADFLDTLNKLYNVAGIDLSDFRAVAENAVASDEGIAITTGLRNYALGENPVTENDQDRTNWTS